MQNNSRYTYTLLRIIDMSNTYNSNNFYDYSCDIFIQDSKVEVEDHNTDKNKPLCVKKYTSTTFIVDSKKSPKCDMCVRFSVTINGRQTVTVERMASRQYACQVFYHRQGINCWKITLAFCPEPYLHVSQSGNCKIMHYI